MKYRAQKVGKVSEKRFKLLAQFDQTTNGHRVQDECKLS